jgi:hypothetical protein
MLHSISSGQSMDILKSNFAKWMFGIELLVLCNHVVSLSSQWTGYDIFICIYLLNTYTYLYIYINISLSHPFRRHNLEKWSKQTWPNVDKDTVIHTPLQVSPIQSQQSLVPWPSAEDGLIIRPGEESRCIEITKYCKIQDMQNVWVYPLVGIKSNTP